MGFELKHDFLSWKSEFRGTPGDISDLELGDSDTNGTWHMEQSTMSPQWIKLFVLVLRSQASLLYMAKSKCTPSHKTHIWFFSRLRQDILLSIAVSLQWTFFQ